MRVCISTTDIVAESVLRKSEENVISFNFVVYIRPLGNAISIGTGFLRIGYEGLAENRPFPRRILLAPFFYTFE